MSEREVHVVFERGTWTVISAVSEEHCEFASKSEAEQHARQRAEILKSPVIIHDEEGQVERHDLSNAE